MSPADEYVHKFVPFVPTLKYGVFGIQNAVAITQQLAGVVEEYTAKGWEYVNLEQVSVVHRAGCIASLFGRQNHEVAYDVVVFRAKPEWVKLSQSPASRSAAGASGVTAHDGDVTLGTMRCPQCGEEYQPGYATCADCGTKLVPASE